MFYIADLSHVKIGFNNPVRLMGAINVSPESFYKGSVAESVEDAINTAVKMVEEGADIIDIGGMSTAPYKETYVPIETELERVKPIIKELSGVLETPISIDTQRSKVAEEALKLGASIVNDVSGLKSDSKMIDVIREYGAGVIIVAHGEVSKDYDPVINIRRLLKESLEIAYKAGVNTNKIVVDPGIGFFRRTWMEWYEWDLYIIKNLYRLRMLRHPIMVGISRKSFIGKVLDIPDPENRLYGSIACEAIAVLNGADMVRTHNILESKHAVRMAEYMRGETRVTKTNDIYALDLTRLFIQDDLREFMIDMDVDPIGADIMSTKGIYKLIYLANIPRLLAIIIKQEMLAAGGDAATPKDTVLGGFEEDNILILGNINHIKKLIRKLRSMRFKSLEERGLPNSEDVADILEELIQEKEIVYHF